MLLTHLRRPPASRFSICGFSRSPIYHSEHPSLRSSHIQTPPFTVVKSFPCHTSANSARNPCICHTSKFIRLKVLCLPHIRKTGGVGGLMLTCIPSGVPGRFLYLITSRLHHLISSGVF